MKLKIFKYPVLAICALALGVSVAYAINYSLVPDSTTGAYDVGSSTKYWGKVYGARLYTKSGTNLAGGTFVANGTSAVTISNTSVTANSVIVITLKAVGGTVGAVPHVDTITPTTGFTIKGTAADTSTYNYAIVELF